MKAGSIKSTVFIWFGLAVVIWVISTFPCIHLYALHHNTLANQGLARSSFLRAYYHTAVWVTLCQALVGVFTLWTLSGKFASGPVAASMSGAGCGLLLNLGAWALLSP